MRAQDILEKRRNRAIAIVMRVKEKEVDPLLDQVEGGKRASAALRKAVLDQLNDFYAMALDVAMSGESATFEFNAETWERRLDEKIDQLIDAAKASPAAD